MDNTGKNKNEYSAGTFAAISTPYGKGGVALVRISGEEALEVGEKMFVPKNGKRLCEIAPNCAVYGKILYKEEEIDDGIAVVFRAPHSFTGEDTVEISCHGGILLSQKVLESAFLCGAKPARPGEFSRTAFLNGKMTLSGAEAVIDLINAENEHQLRIAGKNSAGALTKRIDGIYDELSKLLASVYVCIDYPDEDLSELDDREFCAILSKQKKETSALADSYKTGHAVMEGIKTVIVGRPNTGKSSFLNQLLGRERAIVSPIAGTTRDTVEETATVGRITLRLCDTAGIHETNDLVESLGVRRSLEKLSEAELVLAVFDGSKEATKEDKALLARLEETKVPTVALLNKSDLERKFDIALLSHFETVIFSAKEKEPPEKLTALLEKLFTNGDLSYDDAGILTNARQSAAASAALAALCRAEDAMEKGFGKELAGLDIEEAMARLKDIDGRTVGEDIVSSIFSRFCVGK